MVIAIVVFAVIVLFWSLTLCGANNDDIHGDEEKE